jgi:anthranilate phosphoribosyltransferase
VDEAADVAERPLIDAIAELGAGRNLSSGATASAVGEIMEGQAAESEVAAFLTALRVKGETADELAGAVRAVRERMTGFEVAPSARPLLDTCGTGGDGAGTINVSTATAILAAACGARVAKHGNRSASGNCGSAEVLTELGVAVECEPASMARSLEELGIAFLFAPRFHPALRHAAPARKRLPFRTLFNLVGPLANPARPETQLVGVPHEPQAELVASALAGLGVKRAAVVTGSEGLDEVTLAGPTRARVVESGSVRFQVWEPEDFGLARVETSRLRISGPAEGAERLRRLLSGEPGPDRDVVLANTAAALWVAGRAASLPEGVRRAAEAIDSGAAADLLGRWAVLSRPGD